MTPVEHRTPEEQFALLLDGVLGPDEVGDEIRSLYALTEALDEHVVVPAAEFGFKAELRGTLAAAAADEMGGTWDKVRDVVWMKTARIRNSVRAAMASGVAASMIGTAGVAAASQQALPGELLYPVKELTESARLALTGDLAASGRLHLAFAEERLEEIDEGAADLRSELLIDTLAAMDDHAIDGAEDLLGYATRTADDAVLAEIEAFTARQREGLQAVMARLPSAVVPFAERSLEVLHRIETEVSGGEQPCDCDPADPAVATPDDTPAVSAPGDPVRTPTRPCDCTPGSDAPPAPREPAPPVERPRDEEPPTEEPPAGTPPVDLVPELPGPLDGIGDTLDDVVNDVLDTTDPVTEPLPIDPREDVIDPVDETLDELIDEAPPVPGAP